MNRTRSAVLCCLTLVAAGPATGPTSAPAPLAAGNHVRRLTVDGRPRSYLVHVPRSYDAGRPTPVVVAFHGALMNGVAMAGFTRLSRKADAAGFVVVYPNGLGFAGTTLFFNATAKPGGPGGAADDVKFTGALLDDLATVVDVDAKRVFATGLSNGGMMANRVGAELSDRIAAIAPVAGTLALPDLHPSRPVPVMIFHGTADGIVPFAGPGSWSPKTMQFRSVDETVRAWRSADGCAAGDGTVAETPDKVGDGTTVTTTTWGGGRAGSEVVLVKVNGGGHTWPGGPPAIAVIGTTTGNVSANDLMWDFFCRHPLP